MYIYIYIYNHIVCFALDGLIGQVRIIPGHVICWTFFEGSLTCACLSDLFRDRLLTVAVTDGIGAPDPNPRNYSTGVSKEL